MDNQAEKIKKILDDLIALDPGLKGHEATLSKLIRELLQAQPDTKFDAKVAGELRRKLMAQATVLAGERASNNYKNLTFMKKLNYILGGVAVVAVAVAVVGLTDLGNKGGLPLQVKHDIEVFSSKPTVRQVSSNAFGNLALANFNGDMGGAAGRGGGGGSETSLAAPAPDQNTSSKMVAPPGMGGDTTLPAFVNYKYVYKGEEFSIDGDQVQVYKRVKGLPAGVSADNILNQLNFGLIDMGKFSNTSVESVNIVEEKDWGYNFYINFREGMVSISENWYKWLTPDRQCKDPQCYESMRLKISDIPADEEIIARTNQFLQDHNISVENYGQPYVQNYWKQEYERAQDKSQFYIPDVVAAVYPLKINGQEVYDEGGNKTGLSVNYNVRAGRVSGLYELSNQQYESSQYVAETGKDRILKIAENGGFRGQMYYASVPGMQVTTKTLELGTPSKSMVKLWMPKENSPGDELLVPALIFPVTSQPGSQDYYRKTVVVPLVKEILDSDQGQPVSAVSPLAR